MQCFIGIVPPQDYKESIIHFQNQWSSNQLPQVWFALLDSGVLNAIKHHDIYEPIIKLFERGGGQISIHHHELVGGFGAFPRTISAGRGDMGQFDISDQALQQIRAPIELHHQDPLSSTL
ncbi:hypothetical protein [Paenibacillus donghaensis]|uniref:Uncharacterized protein n=1 Tax=Paenibacillus donghaensis TaxID=414771 RepID=A0A2Z2KIC3_9BACL|nr:hypothetical protein [Paenibacillus donghaensis]ASA25954.1 hypothetical protein B9T62_37735 [Paenibacillus donghaensis]